MFLPQLPLASTFTYNNLKSIFSFQLSFNMSKFIEIHVLLSFSYSDCSTCKYLRAIYRWHHLVNMTNARACYLYLGIILQKFRGEQAKMETDKSAAL